MPRKPNPDAPGRGNRSPRRYHPPPRRVVIGKDIAEALRSYAPEIRLQQLVESLLVEFLSKLNEPRDLN